MYRKKETVQANKIPKTPTNYPINTCSYRSFHASPLCTSLRTSLPLTLDDRAFPLMLDDRALSIVRCWSRGRSRGRLCQLWARVGAKNVSRATNMNLRNSIHSDRSWSSILVNHWYSVSTHAHLLQRVDNSLGDLGGRDCLHQVSKVVSAIREGP
jgi:hypothetical protein